MSSGKNGIILNYCSTKKTYWIGYRCIRWQCGRHHAQRYRIMTLSDRIMRNNDDKLLLNIEKQPSGCFFAAEGKNKHADKNQQGDPELPGEPVFWPDASPVGMRHRRSGNGHRDTVHAGRPDRRRGAFLAHSIRRRAVGVTRVLDVQRHDGGAVRRGVVPVSGLYAEAPAAFRQRSDVRPHGTGQETAQKRTDGGKRIGCVQRIS